MWFTLLATQLTLGAPAIVIGVVGEVEVQVGDARQPLSRFDRVPEGAVIFTGDPGSAQIRLASGSLLRLGANTRIEMEQLEHQDPAAYRKESFKLVVGRVWARVTRLFGGNDSQFQVKTDNAVAGVRGTSFVVERQGDQDRFIVLKGAIEVLREDTSARLDGPGAFASASPQGLSEPGKLQGAELEQLQAAIAGPTAQILRGLRNVPPAPLSAPRELPQPSAQIREHTRRDILGPLDYVDTPAADTDLNAGWGGPLSPAEIEIRLQLPGHDGGN